MRVRIKKGQSEDILKIVVASLDKCVLSLGFEISPERVVLLASDLIDKYKCDSIEDVLEALKQGRQSKLEFPEFASRNRFNLDVVSHWMAQILDKKSNAREGLLKKFKHNDKEPLESVDYESYKNRTEEEKKGRKEMGRHAHREFIRKQAQNQMENNLKTKKQ